MTGNTEDAQSNTIDDAYSDNFSGSSQQEGKNQPEVPGVHEGYALKQTSLNVLKRSQSGSRILPSLPSGGVTPRKPNENLSQLQTIASKGGGAEVDRLSERIAMLENKVVLLKSVILFLVVCCVLLYLMRAPVEPEIVVPIKSLESQEK